MGLPGGQSRGTPFGQVVVVVGTLVEVVVAGTGGRVATVVGVAGDGVFDDGVRVLAGCRLDDPGRVVGVAPGVAASGASGWRVAESSKDRLAELEPDPASAGASYKTESYTSR